MVTDTVVKKDQNKILVSPVEFLSFADNKSESVLPNDMSIYLDLPKNIRVELGKTRMSLREILELEVNEVIELSKQAGESVDIFVDNELIAKGEVVVMDDKFGVRITDIVKITDLEKKIL